MARGTWADAVRVREGRRALERRRGDPFVRTKRNQCQREPLYPLLATCRAPMVALVSPPLTLSECVPKIISPGEV